MTGPKEFDQEKNRLAGLIERFSSLGPAHAAEQTHSFLGRLTGEGWGALMGKHLDHHLRQFGG